MDSESMRISYNVDTSQMSARNFKEFSRLKQPIPNPSLSSYGFSFLHFIGIVG